MSEIIKQEDNVSLSKKIEFSKQTSLLKDHDSDSIHDVVKVALVKAKQVTGYNTTTEDLAFFINEAKQELLSGFKGLHLSEISISFDLWSKKYYGEWTGFTVSNYLTYGLRPYYSDQKRLEALQSKETPKQVEASKWDGTKRYEELLAEHKEKGICEDTGNLVYDWLIQEGKIQMGYGKQFYAQAQQQLLKENKVKMLGELNQFNRNAIQKLINEIESKSSNQTIVLAKKLALNAYFKDII